MTAAVMMGLLVWCGLNATLFMAFVLVEMGRSK